MPFAPISFCQYKSVRISIEWAQMVIYCRQRSEGGHQQPNHGWFNVLFHFISRSHVIAFVVHLGEKVNVGFRFIRIFIDSCTNKSVPWKFHDECVLCVLPLSQREISMFWFIVFGPVYIGPETRVALKCIFVRCIVWFSKFSSAMRVFSSTFPSFIINFPILFLFSVSLFFNFFLFHVLSAFFHRIFKSSVLACCYDFSCFSQWTGNNFHGSIFT